MCGIAGYCLDPKHYARVEAADLAGQMLFDIEHRGGDATGAAWINPRTGKRVISKAPVSATKFVPRAGAGLCEGATTAILHTRFATQGSPKVKGNNHPIPRGKIVLTHNGHISNDKELFKRLNVPRVAQVDSEAVAALVAFDTGKPWEYLTEVYGTAALAWIRADDARSLHLARVNSSPLYIGQANTGSLFYGSTLETVENAAIMSDCELDWIHTAQEGEYFQVRDGRVIEYKTFTPAKTEVKWWETYYDDHYGNKSNKTTLSDADWSAEWDYFREYDKRHALGKWWSTDGEDFPLID